MEHSQEHLPNDQPSDGFDKASVGIRESSALVVAAHGTNTTEYTLRLVPFKDLKTAKLDSTASIELKETGKVRLELMRGDGLSCVLVSELAVHCKDTYSLQGSGCIEDSDSAKTVIGAVAGSLLACALLSLLVYLRQNPEKFRKLVV